MILESIFCFFIFTLLVLISFFIGFVFLYKLEKENKALIFFSTLVGSIALISLGSIITTWGITYSWLYIIIGLFAYWINRKNYNSEIYYFDSLKKVIREEKVFLLISFFVMLLVFSAKIGMFWSENSLITELDTDQAFYVRIASWLIEIGKESTNVPNTLFNEDFEGIVIYHYFEIWMGALLGKLTGISYSITLFLIVHSFFNFLIYLGSVCLFETVIDKKRIENNYYLKIIIYLICVLFPFSSSIYLNQFISADLPYSDAFHFIHGNHGVAFIHLKMAVLEVFFLAALICFWRKKWKNAIFILLVLVVVSPATAPVALVLCCIVAFFYQMLFLFLKTRIDSKKIYSGYLLIVLSFIIAIGLGGSAYIFAPQNTSVMELGEMLIGTQEYIRLVLYRIIQQPFLYLPFSLLFLFLVRKRLDIILIYSLLFFVAASIGSIFYEINWKQFFSMSVFPNAKILFTTLTIALSINFLISLKDRKKQIIFIGIILPCIALLSFRTVRNIQLKWQDGHISNTSYTNQVIFTLDSLANQNANKYVLGGSYQSPIFFDSLVVSSPVFAEITTGGNYTHFSNYPIFLLNYNLIDYTENENGYLKSYTRRSPLFIYAQKNNIDLSNKAEIMYKFSKENNIQFLVVNDINSLPIQLQNSITKKIKDEKSDDIFCVIDIK